VHYYVLLFFPKKKIPASERIDIADLQLKYCAFEPDAPAMKLFDIQETAFDMLNYGTKLKTERKVCIKIFNEKGYKYATVRIPYFSKKGIARIKELSGAIYNLAADGKISVQRLEKKDFFRVKAIENVGMVNFTFPNLKPGSIIEYSYTTVENNLVYITPWLIQDQIPVLYTSKSIVTPVQSRIIERVFGADTLEQRFELLRSDQYRRLVYFKENIPSFKAEPYMSSINDHLVRASFLLFPRGAAFYSNNLRSPGILWKAAGSQFLSSRFVEEQVRKIIPGTEKIIDSAKTILSVKQRIGFIYNEVKRRIPDKIEQTTKADDLADAWTNKTGTSAEINFILLNLLEKANIKCLPVLISTRDNGKINKDFPSVGQLNGVDVLAMDSSTFYILDASLKFQSFQNPPLNILNREAFILIPDSMQWVTITDNRPLLKQSVHVIADLNEAGKMEGTGSIQYYDYAKAYKLDTVLKNEKELFDKTPAGLKILSSKMSDADQEQEPLLETIEFVYEPQQTGDFFFINPQILTERNKNPFVDNKRNTDIDFGCNQLFILTMQIRFPSTYLIEHLPKNITVRAPDSSFFYKIAYSSDTRNIFISQVFEVKKTIFSKEEYPGIQDFFKRMYALMAEEIILKRSK
jgi:hypothetical protein